VPQLTDVRTEGLQAFCGAEIPVEIEAWTWRRELKGGREEENLDEGRKVAQEDKIE
jgi:hypothetical protein